MSTDLGVSYYYSMNRPDEALAQFERSLKISPNHVKTLFNKGIVLAFGKENLQAAAEEWKKVIDAVAGFTGRSGCPSSARGSGGRSRWAGHDEPVIKVLLIGILVLLIARAFWRVVDGILDGCAADGRTERGCRAGEARSRPSVRHVRRARYRAVSERRRDDALLLF